MSSPKRRIELSKQAKEDFRDILSYTLTAWGESRLAKYRASINDALHVILQNPSIGRPSVKPNLKVLPVEHHRIFYRDIGGTIYIVRILHDRMDTSAIWNKQAPGFGFVFGAQAGLFAGRAVLEVEHLAHIQHACPPRSRCPHLTN